MNLTRASLDRLTNKVASELVPLAVEYRRATPSTSLRDRIMRAADNLRNER